MENKTKTWLIIGLFIIAIIIAVAIYKGIQTAKTTTVSTTGGGSTTTTNGIGALLTPILTFFG